MITTIMRSGVGTANELVQPNTASIALKMKAYMRPTLDDSAL